MASTLVNRQRRSISRRIAARFGWRAVVYYWLRKGFGSRLRFTEKGSTLYLDQKYRWSPKYLPRVFSGYFMSVVIFGIFLPRRPLGTFGLWDLAWLLFWLPYLYLVRRRFPQERPLVRVGQNTLTLELPGYLWPRRIKASLATLRRVNIALPYPINGGVPLKLMFIDGKEKTVKLPYSPQILDAVCDFLRSKLPPSVQLTVDVAGPR